MSVWEGTRALRGTPGTAVTLTLLRGNATDPHVVDVTREALTPPAPATRLAADGIGLIRLAAFADRTPAALADAAARLEREGARALIVDVRNTANGPLVSGLDAARLFVASGTLAQLETRGGTRQTVTAAAGDGKVTVPLAVLIDGGTAGAAELFAAAIGGNKRGDLIGERTAGRTALQRLSPLPDGSALWLSYACYLSPGGEAIHERGLVPGIPVEQPDVEFGAAPPAADATIDKVIERLRTRSAS
jgi:carboxyl-terminal processing protease